MMMMVMVIVMMVVIMMGMEMMVVMLMVMMMMVIMRMMIILIVMVMVTVMMKMMVWGDGEVDMTIMMITSTALSVNPYKHTFCDNVIVGVQRQFLCASVVSIEASLKSIVWICCLFLFSSGVRVWCLVRHTWASLNLKEITAYYNILYMDHYFECGSIIYW